VYYKQHVVYKIIWLYSSGSSSLIRIINQHRSRDSGGWKNIQRESKKIKNKKFCPIVRYRLDGLTKTHINILYRQQYRHTDDIIIILSTASTAVNRPADKGVVCRSAATVADRDEGFGEGRRSMVFYATTDPTGHHLRERVDRRHLYTYRSCNNIIYVCLYTYT